MTVDGERRQAQLVLALQVLVCRLERLVPRFKLTILALDLREGLLNQPRLTTFPTIATYLDKPHFDS